jgi:hypothetical protein
MLLLVMLALLAIVAFGGFTIHCPSSPPSSP